MQWRPPYYDTDLYKIILLAESKISFASIKFTSLAQKSSVQGYNISI